MEDDNNSNVAPSVPDTSQEPPTADTAMDLAPPGSSPAATSGLSGSTQEARPKQTEKEQPSPLTPRFFGGGSGSGSIAWGHQNPATPSVAHSFGEKALTTTTVTEAPGDKVVMPSIRRTSTSGHQSQTEWTPGGRGENTRSTHLLPDKTLTSTKPTTASADLSFEQRPKEQVSGVSGSKSTSTSEQELVSTEVRDDQDSLKGPLSESSPTAEETPGNTATSPRESPQSGQDSTTKEVAGAKKDDRIEHKSETISSPSVNEVTTPSITQKPNKNKATLPSLSPPSESYTAESTGTNSSLLDANKTTPSLRHALDQQQIPEQNPESSVILNVGHAFDGKAPSSMDAQTRKVITTSGDLSMDEKSATANKAPSSLPPTAGDSSDQRSHAEEATPPVIPSEDDRKVTPPPQNAGLTLASSALTYGAPSTAPPRKYIHGEFPNNLDASAVDLHDLPIADWCTLDSEFESPRDLSYAEAHAHDWSLDEQWMRTRWHPKRYLRSQVEDGEDIEVPIRNTTARLVDMMPCKDYEAMALFVPMPRDKHRPSEERSWGFGSGSGSGGRWGSNAPALSVSLLTSPRAFEILGLKSRQGTAKTKKKKKKKKKDSSSKEDKEVIDISDDEDEEESQPLIKQAKKGQTKRVTTTTKSGNDGTPTSTVKAGKARAREPSSSSPSSASSSSSSGEPLDNEKFGQAILSKPMGHKELRKMRQAVNCRLKKSKHKYSPSMEMEQEHEEEVQEHFEQVAQVKKEEEVPSSTPTVREQEQEDLEEGRGAFETVLLPRQRRRGPQDEAVGARLRSDRADRANATRSTSRSYLSLDPSSTKPDPAPSLPLALPAMAGAALWPLVDGVHHQLDEWRAAAMAQMDKFNAYFNLPLFGVGTPVSDRPSQSASLAGAVRRGGERVSGPGPENGRGERGRRVDRAEGRQGRDPSMATRFGQARHASKVFFERALTSKTATERLRAVNHAATRSTTTTTTRMEIVPEVETAPSSTLLGWDTTVSIARSTHGSEARNTAVRGSIDLVQEETLLDPAREDGVLVLNLDDSKSESSLEKEGLEEGQIKEGAVEEELRQQDMSSSDEDKETPLSPDDLTQMSPMTSCKSREYQNLDGDRNKRIWDAKSGKQLRH
ncbi:hypothetical protein BG000_011183 [Podila horticola]|nr:hypothetical protein BG000_011183 [Podila horticola]